MIRTAVIGTGYIGMVHIENLMRLPGVQVVAVADANESLLDSVRKSYEFDLITQDVDELLKRSDIDVVHNCTPNNVHYEINKAIMESGKHIFSEKPLSTTAKEAKELLDMAESNGLAHGINFCYRYYPTVQEAAAKVRNGEIGEVREILGSYLQDWLLFDTDYSWRLDKSVSGTSNTVADIGCHWFDLAQFISGCNITGVLGDLKTFIPKRKRPSGAVLSFAGGSEQETEDVNIEVEDYASVLLRFDTGARGVTSVSQLCAGRKCRIDMQVYGSTSALAWNHEDPSVLWQGHRDRACEYLRENALLQHESTSRFARLPSGHPMGYHDAVFNLFRDYYQNVRDKMNGNSGSNSVPDFRVGHNQMQIVEAALESAKTESWAKVS